jgi:SWI/SNF-related matrix-associated actin-dependent regulator 1 of chromatin subfamily A
MDLNLDWSKGEKQSDGRLLKTAKPTPEFWALWKVKKAAIKKAGYTVSKINDAWLVTHMVDDNAAIEDSVATNSDMQIPVPAGLEYLPYQKAGIAYAAGRKSTLIGDEMGLGKTIQAIGTINVTNPKTVLVVCPASLKLNWKNEMVKWLVSERTIDVVNGGGEQIPSNPDVVIINYDVLTKHAKALQSRTWDMVIMDEVHKIKNPKAKRTVVAVNIKAKRKVLLTGTPITNRPIELQPIAGYLDPESFGNYYSFGRRYAAAYKGRFGWDDSGSSNLDELQRRLRQSFMIRRKKDEVLKDLPAKVRQVIVLPSKGYTQELTKEFDALSDAVEETSFEEVSFEKMSEVRHEMALAKVNDVVDHLTDLEHQVVVMAHHKDVVQGIQEGLEAVGKTVVTLTGDCNQAHRQNSVDTFQAGKADVFIGTIGAAGVGITLTKASHVVFAELDWVPGNMSQAEDRCHRIGQEDSVLVQHLVVDGSIDARMAEALVGKQKVLDKALDNVQVLDQSISINDLAVGVKEVEKMFHNKKLAPLSNEIVDAMRSCAAYLASRCDGALEEDGQGYNGLDSRFGKSITQQLIWTPAVQHAAKKMLKKYREQLLQGGLSVEYNSIY